MEWCCHCLGEIKDETHHTHCKEYVWRVFSKEFSENKRKFLNMKFGPEVHKGETISLDTEQSHVSLQQ